TPNPGTGTVTPFIELDEHQRRMSLNVSLADLSARATALYAMKNYDEAAEIYAQAAEMQAEMNGEMSPENAEILFLYGRTLFKVGQSKSDVLGGKAPAAGEGGAKKSKKGKKTAGVKAAGEAVEEKVASIAEEATKTEESTEKKPLFQFTGDENFDESDDEDDEAEGEEGEDDDDLGVAFEILDLSRVLFLKRLEAEQQRTGSEGGKGKDADEGDSPAVRHIKERLGDTHDLLAEISLENERYTDAIKDSRESLKYKQELYTEESELVAEAHFKLSLALEFASVTHTQDENAEAEAKPVDQDMRDEAAKELQAAIDSTKLKLQAKQVDLATLHSPEDNELTRQQIADVQEVIADMEQRLIELQKPPIDVNAAVYGAAANAMGGLFGAATGPAEAEARIEEAKKTATDLSGLVRKKKAKDEPAAAETNGHGKRKAEEPADAATEADSKKAKVE
ncbi:hypothetical protein CONLIGDRAFT_562372, partial [Coniochaeta ligniaria NRRL 30616]